MGVERGDEGLGLDRPGFAAVRPRSAGCPRERPAQCFDGPGLRGIVRSAGAQFVDSPSLFQWPERTSASRLPTGPDTGSGARLEERWKHAGEFRANPCSES
ncbi:hypothetical protein KCH_63560 [Kitasatospora cheerisanensis KCTC 2395]|uniref:Uncharacterized protein n=1 Tax=Kitasatospora cheerisanensis KCTC 2395 TaxID=1348663 RepID=A0A066YL64_9ACTN|nr:hypothetical protein KCH_63560 [Kitasatospora cheerisanensis KCTC 2395]